MTFSTDELRSIYRGKVENQKLSLSEFKEKKLVLESRPSKVLLELTQNCNFRCRMCPQSFDEKYKKYNPALNLKPELFEKVANSLFEKAYFVDLRGFGETVILPYWPEIVDGLDRYPFINWHLVTNLSLPRDGTWEKMMRNGFLLGFSCDAATKETFEKIRVRSRFETILHNLELVTDCIKKYGKGFIYFIVTVQRGNIHELPQIVELAAKFSVPEVQFKIVQRNNAHEEHLTEEHAPALAEAVGRSVEVAIERGIRLTINDQEMLQGIDRAKAKRASEHLFPPPGLNFPATDESSVWRGIDLEVLDNSKVSVYKRCFKPFHYTYIDSEGRVGTCNHMMNPGILEMGNLNEQSFDEIWNGENYRFFRSSLLYGKALDPRCRWCFEHRLED